MKYQFLDRYQRIKTITILILEIFKINFCMPGQVTIAKQICIIATHILITLKYQFSLFISKIKKNNTSYTEIFLKSIFVCLNK